MRSFLLGKITLIGILLAFGYVCLAQQQVSITPTAIGVGGAPVTTLTKGDFSVQDSGKAKTIGSFLSPRSDTAKPQELKAHEFSNAVYLTESGAIFIVLDTIHTRYIDERDFREMILKFLAKAAQANHAITLAIMSEKGLKTYHDYRTSSDVLMAALTKAGLGGTKGAAVPAGLNEADVSAETARLTAFAKGDLSNATPPEQLLRSSVDAPLLMFQDVARSGYGMPGRKALIWITNAVPFDVDAKTMQLQSPKQGNFGVAVNGSQVGGTKDAISADQMKTLMPIWRRSVQELVFSGTTIYPVEARGAFSSASGTFTVAVMKTLAQLTGGKAFYGTNDPFPEILQLSNGNVAGYRLSYLYDGSMNADFHHVEVSTSNAALTISHPAGYFVTQVTPKDKAGSEVSMAMQSPLEYTAVTFKVEIGTIEAGEAGKKKVNLAISLPGDAGVLNESTRTVDVGLLAVAVDAKGEQVGKMNESAGGQFPPEAIQQIKELGFELKRSMEVKPGDSTVHFLIRDNQTGAMGTIIFPLKVQ
jgi:VWFA-related protein